MSILRLTQSAISSNRFRVETALEADGFARQTATAEFDFLVTPQDREDLRWYLEDYLQNAGDPAPKIAARIESRIAEMGTDLFKALFQGDDDTRDLWATLRDRLNGTRVEIITGVHEATTLPWELLRDPKTDVPLALRASAFVRAAHQVAQRPQLLHGDGGLIRILLVICRPGGADDVPFRSVASRLIKGLSASARETFQLDVLRPPTFPQLAKVLRAARTAGKPYHVVHFDGHGTYAKINEAEGLATLRHALSSLMLSGGRAGAHGYLLFENPSVDENLQLVDGTTLGKLLAETGVSVLVLNACRSAHAEAATAPSTVQEQLSSTSGAHHTAPSQNLHSKVRAFGSLAQEVVDAGVAGVVAMRYNVYVVTAAQFVADLYESLAAGQPLGEAVTMGRKQLSAQPLREITYQPRPLQDWMVPIVYEAAPVALFPKPAQKAELKITVTAHATAPSSGVVAAELEKRPDVGFFGRDETLLALDRAFDTQAIVLLHAYAGSGKTSTAAEFARWYHLTGGIEGQLLFTSFGQYKSMTQVLNETIGSVFGDMLERSGLNWLALADQQRREVALQVLEQIPVLWIWDNVEPIAGFPVGTASAWSDAEQKALADFLRASMLTKAKFLLTSRRDERNWLGELPARIQVPPMPMQERVQLSQALAEKHRRRLIDVGNWMPLLHFTGGNPLTLTVLVGQALRDRLETKTEIETFVNSLRAGEAAFDDEAIEGRDKSLAISLSYGFENTFSEDERKQLALLHFFQGFVNVTVLQVMGDLNNPKSIPELRGLTRETGIALLDRASEIGLLTEKGRGFYSIHPALPWHFRHLFNQYYTPSSPPEGQSPREKATQAFVVATGLNGLFASSQYQKGHREFIDLLVLEEANLLHAQNLARKHGWADAVMDTMKGLGTLYQHTGRNPELLRLINEIVPEFVDDATGTPLPGKEDYWTIIVQYQVRLLRQALQWTEAERLQQACVDWDYERTARARAKPIAELSRTEREGIKNLIASIQDLAHILREQYKHECVGLYEDSLRLCQRFGDTSGEALAAFNIGHAYSMIPSLNDLEKAERWYQRSLELRGEKDFLGQARCLSQLGIVAYYQFIEARDGEQPKSEVLRHLNRARQFLLQAGTLTPPDAIRDISSAQYYLGRIYADAGEIDAALLHYREAIRCEEKQGNNLRAAEVRKRVALCLAQAGRLNDAWEYAHAASRNLETYGDRAAENIQQLQVLIAEIERLQQIPKG